MIIGCISFHLLVYICDKYVADAIAKYLGLISQVPDSGPTKRVPPKSLIALPDKRQPHSNRSNITKPHPLFRPLRLVEADLALIDIRIDIEPSLRIYGDVPPRLGDLRAVELPEHDILALPGLDDDPRHGVDDQAVAPGVVGRAHVARGAAQRDVALVVEGAPLGQQAPVQRARDQVEGARVDEGEGAAARGDHGELGEAHVVADGDGDAAVTRQVHERQPVAPRQHLALAERDAARDVDVEEVHLAVAREQRAVGPEDEGRVVVFLALALALASSVFFFFPRFRFGDRAADEEDAGLGGHGRQRVEGRRLLGRGRGREEGLGVRGEVVASVGRVEALGQHDEVRAGPRGLEDLVARVREVRRLVGPAGELHARELDGLLEDRRRRGRRRRRCGHRAREGRIGEGEDGVDSCESVTEAQGRASGDRSRWEWFREQTQGLVDEISHVICIMYDGHHRI